MFSGINFDPIVRVEIRQGQETLSRIETHVEKTTGLNLEFLVHFPLVRVSCINAFHGAVLELMTFGKLGRDS